MKKKGLIISTVVMVVVLLASLTTATYAWFSSTATASVGNIAVNVGSTSSVQIGIQADASSAGNTNAHFLFGDVNATSATEWEGGGIGLGQIVNTGLTLDVKSAVGTGTKTGDDWTLDPKLEAGHDYCVAAGSNPEEASKNVSSARVNIDTTPGTDAPKNVDVIDLNLGVRVATSNLTGIYGKITISPNDAIMGMATALWFEIKVGGKTYDAGDIFGDKHWGSAKEDGVFCFKITDDADALKFEEGKESVITTFSIKFFICGYDSDCCNDANGTSAVVSLEFDGMTADTDTTGWLELKA